MQHSINDINILPTPTQLRKISQSLAILDAIIMPEWNSRYFSFDAHWDTDKEEMMASMKTGEGGEYYILFYTRNALGKVYSSDTKLMSKSEISKLEDKVPYMLASFMEEEAFDVDNASFFFWFGRTDKSWTCTEEESNLDYLKFLMGDAIFYKEWAEKYYEKSIDLDVVKKIMKHSPLTSAMVEKLNPLITIKELSEDIKEIGYPLWKKKGKRKTLPDDFQELITEGDVEKLKKIFDICELDAYDYRFSKTTAITYSDCPDELVRWLIGKGLDVNILDYYDRTPLYHRAGSWYDINILLELGADVNIGYPLHNAASSGQLTNTRLLLEADANVNKKDEDNLIPLEYALQQITANTIKYVVDIAKLLLEHGSKRTAKMKKFIKEIGENYQFHNSYANSANKDYFDETSLALDELYILFDVEPVEKRVMHDGKSEIVIKEKKWKKQFNELWDMLTPSSGHATTMQGEVIRIAGRIADEIDRNGGINWDSEYRKMGKAYLKLVGTGEPLSETEIAKLKTILSGLTSLYDETDNLAKYAVKWVSQNTTPTVLPKPNYNR